MTKHSITSTITKTKFVGPDFEECEVTIPVCVSASITPPDRSVGIDSHGWEDLEITDDGKEIEVSEEEAERLGEEVVVSYLKDDAIPHRGAPSEFYD